jgi:hypothetical protein
VAEAAEIVRSECDPSRCVQPLPVFEATQKSARRAVDIDEAEARPVSLELLTFFQKHVRHDDIVSDCLHVERYVVIRQTIVFEGTLAAAIVFFVECEVIVVVAAIVIVVAKRNAEKRVVINVDSAFGEICGVEKLFAVNEGAGQPCVARTVGCSHDSYRIRGWRCYRWPAQNTDRWIPRCDGSVDRREKKERRGFRCEQKICGAAVKDGAGWRT